MLVSSTKVRQILLGGLTLVVAGLVVLVAHRGQENGAPASAVLQGASVVLSVYGGIVFTREGNDEHIRAVAKASARRVLVNYQTLGQFGTAVSNLRARLNAIAGKDGLLNIDFINIALDGLQDQIVTQVMSADAAIQDWRDLAPTEVDEEVDKVRKSRISNG
jgi:hypothetical protein